MIIKQTIILNQQEEEKTLKNFIKFAKKRTVVTKYISHYGMCDWDKQYILYCPHDDYSTSSLKSERDDDLKISGWEEMWRGFRLHLMHKVKRGCKDHVDILLQIMGKEITVAYIKMYINNNDAYNYQDLKKILNDMEGKKE